MAQNAFLDFLQAASNSAASNISGPVDLIGAGLRGMGMPVPRNALMSSQWMAERGLTKQPKNALMQVAGETAGMVSPMALAAKAPQVASALLQGGRNLAAPRQAGMIAGQRGAITASHNSVLERAARGTPDDLAGPLFDMQGAYVYHTPLRPFENAQATAIGGKASSVGERLFSTSEPLSAAKLASIEAYPATDAASMAFARELADEGAMALMHRDGKRFSVVMPSSKEAGKFQLTNYDTKGAIGDSQHKDAAEAIQRLIGAGYSKVLDPSRADKLMSQVMR